MAQPFKIDLSRRDPTRASEVTAAIILAAGASTRMGTPKANLPFRGGTFLSHLTARLSAHCNPVITVTGAIALASGQHVFNADWQQGQLSSLQCGLRALPPVDSAIFTLVDHPDPADATIAALLNSVALIAIPVYNGRKGHPVFFQSALIPELLALPQTASAKEVFRRHIASTEYIPVNDAGVTDDIDDPTALAAFRARTEHA